jgi:putative peptide zinc metalloprotease protein
MARERALFSESWHRVARQKIRLRPSVTVHKQFFRGELWYIAHDTYGDQYFRFRPEAWDFIARLDGRATVEEIWQACLDRNRDAAPGQGEVVQMLAQLYNGNLILSDVPADVTQLFERLKKRRANEWKSRIFGIFFLRIPLWDPDAFLNRTIGLMRPLLSWFGALLWLAAGGAALALVVGHWERATDQSAGVFDPSNLALLYVAFALTKLLHEMGHAYAVKRFDGEVHRMGITFLVFTPIPFVDATAAWAFRERWKRVWVGSAGMIVELFFAALAAFVWVGTGPGLINGLAYNVMIVASVSTLLFNLNPLLRFDGYYILADLTDSPNLQPRSTRQWFHWIERYAFGGKLSNSPAESTGETIWLSSFGAAAWIYRIFITFTIIIFVADKFFGLGFLAAVLTLIGFVVLPLYKGVRYLLTEPRIERVRGRAIGITLAFLAVLFILLGVVPFPNHFRAPGVIKAGQSQYLITGVAGEVDQVLVGESDRIPAGAPVIRMRNPELELEIADLRAELARIDAAQRRSFAESPGDLAPLAERRRVTEARLANRYERQAALAMNAPVAGQVALANPNELLGRWLQRGAVAGEVVGGGDYEFRAVVSQGDASRLFTDEATKFELRFPGSAARAFVPTGVRIVPGQQDFLPSPALGWPAGGPIRVDAQDPSGLRAYEPFFLVVGRFPEESGEYWHGRTGVARFEAPPQPLLQQWLESLRQLLQRRFQI